MFFSPSKISLVKFTALNFVAGNFVASNFCRVKFRCMIFLPRPISPLEIWSPEISTHEIFAAIFVAALNFAAEFFFLSENTFSYNFFQKLRSFFAEVIKKHRRCTGYDWSEAQRVIFTNILEDLVPNILGTSGSK